MLMSGIRDLGRAFYLSLKRYVDARHGQRALALTYYTVFSIVPLMALLFGIAKGFSFEEQLQTVVYEKFAHQREILAYVCRFAETTLKQASGGVVAGVGVIALFWTVFWLIHNVESAFNAIWGLPERHNWWRKFSSYLSLMLLTPLAMVVVGTAGVMIRSRLTDFLEASPAFTQFGLCVLEFMVHAAPVLLACFIFVLVYRFVPNTRVRFIGALIGGVVTGILYQLLQDGFIFLQGSVFRYNRIYGSFAALPLLLIWLNWSWQIILFGAELSCVVQNLKSGMFDSFKLRRINLTVRREHQMAILKLVFNRFEHDCGALPESELLLKLRLPEVLLRSEIDELLDSGLICRSVSENDGPGLLPGTPPERLTVAGFLKRLDGSGDGETAEFAPFDHCIKMMAEEISQGSGGKLIRDL